MEVEIVEALNDIVVTLRLLGATLALVGVGIILGLWTK